MPDPIRLSLKTLRAFAVTVEQGSITAAAAQLNTAASAIAAALDQVEAEFGASLLVRTRARGIAATAEGHEMAARFRTLLDDYADTLDTGRSLGQGLRGTLRIGYYAPVAPAFLPAVLGPLIAANPELQIDLREHDNDSAQEALLAGRLDLILFAGDNLRRGIKTHPLLSLPPYVLAPKGHALHHQRPLTLPEVARHPLILLDRALARPYVEGMFRNAGCVPRIVARADSIEMVRSLVAAGAGLAVLSMRPRSTMSYAGQPLACLPLSDGLPGLRLYAGHAAHPPRKLVSTVLQDLQTWMRRPAAKQLIVG